MTAQRRCVVSCDEAAALAHFSAGPQTNRMVHKVLTAIIFFFAFPLNVCFSETYVLNDKEGLGRVFDGIGGLSGGGVSTVPLPVTVLSAGGRLNISVLTTSTGLFRRRLVYWSTMPSHTAARF